MYRVHIPASSGNMCVGFDSTGLALQIYNSIDFEARKSGLVIEMDTPAPFIPTDGRNLIVRAAKRAADRMGKRLPGLYLKQYNRIPHTRGLGSSAACIVGGILLADTLLGAGWSREQVLSLASEMEGHPDNVTPALLGGLKAALVEQDCLLTADFSVSERLRFAALVPDFELETHRARQALPDTIPHAQAAGALGKLAFLLKGLETADSALLEAAMNEPLHEPYRIPLIPEYEEVRQLCVNQGAAAVMISGSGPTLLALFLDTLPEAALTLKLKSLNHHWQLLPCRVQHEGTRIEMKEEPHE